MATNLLLSASERKYISSGVQENIRSDGRHRMDQRFFDVKTNVILNANGSAQIQIDRTDVLVAVKISIEEPAVSTPRKGRFECSVECASSASMRFGDKGARILNSQLTSALQKMLEASIDLDALCIVPRKQCWAVFVDAVVLDSSGNLSDALSMATYAALKTTTLPVVEVVKAEESNEIIVEVSEDPFETTPLKLLDVPVTVTLTKIGSSFVMDATAEEESCMSAMVTFGTDSNGKICFTRKRGIGGISEKLLMEMMKIASSSGKTIVDKVEEQIAKQNQ